MGFVFLDRAFVDGILTTDTFILAAWCVNLSVASTHQYSQRFYVLSTSSLSQQTKMSTLAAKEI